MEIPLDRHPPGRVLYIVHRDRRFPSLRPSGDSVHNVYPKSRESDPMLRYTDARIIRNDKMDADKILIFSLLEQA